MVIVGRKKDTDMYMVMTQQIKYDTISHRCQRLRGYDEEGAIRATGARQVQVERQSRGTTELHVSTEGKDQVGMTVDDAVFSGILASSPPPNERFDRLRSLGRIA
ncbi:hypothetical protein GN244_ATG12473 [Phytophthora infestans]|uniref:Uncharacterized protein n=1 Tax=Phytophthora infestans TaxID=4787 RepID=A0A833WHT1_PHYIN|nr:hypothetical protein GN244_ATG12473 [Phytophthora infestans]